MLFTSVSEKLAGHPSELVYLQTNKGIYETGEDLWFKAYGLDAQSFGLSDRSKTLYLQMMDAKDSVVWREKYPIENGIADGHVYMDEKLVEGIFLWKHIPGTRFLMIRRKCWRHEISRWLRISPMTADKRRKEKKGIKIRPFSRRWKFGCRVTFPFGF